MVLHNHLCISADLRLDSPSEKSCEKLRHLAARRQAQLEAWLAKFVSALLVSVTRPLLLTRFIFF